MVLLLQFFRSKLVKLHGCLLQNCHQLLLVSLLVGCTTGAFHWLLVRHPALLTHLHENLRTFPVEISCCALSLFSAGCMLSITLYHRHRVAKARRALANIRQRYIDFIVLCLIVSVTNAARRHLQAANKEGLTLRQLEAYRREVESAIALFRWRAKKLLQEPPSTLAFSSAFLQRYFRLDDNHFGEEIFVLKRDTKSLLNVPAIKGLLDC